MVGLVANGVSWRISIMLYWLFNKKYGTSIHNGLGDLSNHVT